MDDDPSDIPKRKREEDDARTEGAEESPAFLEWLEKKRENEAVDRLAALDDRAAAPTHPKQGARSPLMTGYEKRTLKELAGIVALMSLFAIGAVHYDQIKSALSGPGGPVRGAINTASIVLGQDTATVQQVRSSQSRRYLYLNDGTVWEYFPYQQDQFFVLPGDEVRFKFSGVRTYTSPSNFDGETCFVEDVTRPQASMLMIRMAGDSKRDSCPAQ